jgi:hypothetical protein
MGQQQTLFDESRVDAEPLTQPAATAVRPSALTQNPNLNLRPPPPDAPARELALHKALATAKDQLIQLRARLVRADSVAWVWANVPRHPDSGNARDVEAECGRLMLRVLSGENELSLKTACEQWSRQRAEAGR